MTSFPGVTYFQFFLRNLKLKPLFESFQKCIFSAQENRYTFAHYYGNRREDGANHVHRDFAQEGGFLCPSGKHNSMLDMLRW